MGSSPTLITTSILLFLCHLFTTNFSLPPFFFPFFSSSLSLLSSFSFLNNQEPHRFSLWTIDPESLFLTQHPVTDFLLVGDIVGIPPVFSWSSPFQCTLTWFPAAARTCISLPQGLLGMPESALPRYRCNQPHKFRGLTLPKSSPQWLRRGYINAPVPSSSG